MIIGCGSSPSSNPSSSSSKPAKVTGTLVIGGFGGTTPQGLQTCGIKSFEKAYPGVTVQYIAGQGSETIAKVAASKNDPTIDLMMLQSADLYNANRLGLVGTESASAVPNIQDLKSLYGSKPMYGGGVPLGTLSTGIAYNTQVFKEHGWAAPNSWNDLWDPKFKGHVAIITITVGGTQAWVQTLGEIDGGSVDNAAPLFKKLGQLKPNLYAVDSTSAQLAEQIQQQHVWIAPFSGNQVAPLQAQGVPIQMIIPKEGIELAVTYLTLVKGAPNTAAAEAFQNWMLAQKQQQCVAKVVGYGPVRKGITAPASIAALVGPLPTTKIIPSNFADIQKNLPEWVSEWDSELGS
jgi:putative spermidine/putrescine transport system substrate-binding protein